MRVLSIAALVLAASLLSTTGSPSAQERYVQGVFVGTSQGPVELVAWAESSARRWLEFRSGRVQLRMAHLTLDDAPAVPDVQRVLVNLPHYYPTSMLAATAAFFEDETAERRDLPFAVRKLALWTFEVRAADLEEASGVTRLLRSLNASDDTPGFFFVVVEGEQSQARFYPFRVQ